jgi:hypothetical protein
MENDFKTDRRKKRLSEMECIKTAEDSLKWPLRNVTKFFVSEKAGVFLLAT